jgi:hypothetical protein
MNPTTGADKVGNIEEEQNENTKTWNLESLGNGIRVHEY